MAFGFFNIETHLMLLERLFFFADDFCRAARELVHGPRAVLEGYRVEREQLGDLHGAIAGEDLSGFIGATYRLFPFPSEPEAFRQAPDGERNARVVSDLLCRFGVPERIPLLFDAVRDAVEVGEIHFSRPGFVALLRYVVQGGYPRWREERRPLYVEQMLADLTSAESPFRAP